MALVRWDPFRELLDMRDRVDRLFKEAFGRSGFEEDIVASTGAYWPAVDVYEDDNSIAVTAELPGMKLEDIKVEVKNHVLSIKGEKKMEKELKEDNFHRMERVYGSFQRSFTLPANVEHEKVKATYKDGVLKIVIPKKEEAKPKEIPITSEE